SNTFAAQPWASGTSPTTSPDHSWNQAASDPNCTLNYDEPVLPASHARQLGNFKDALRTTPTRRFSFDYMVKELDGELTSGQIKALLKQMFETGGIGIQNGSYTDFVFRATSGGGFSTRYTFLLHDALVRAWNRPWH
ncbi:hypothetical protein, partial [Arthrobacter echini]|uniref:hypothetical protein n=1 Tax=Arthrobacter echini TaxID=1529066 RepID=UPI001B3BF109